jgi:hypothetical protein
MKNLDRIEADIFLILLLEAKILDIGLVRQQRHLKFMFHSHHYWDLVDMSEKVNQLKVNGMLYYDVLELPLC